MIVAIGIKISSPGPIIFKQVRYGKRGIPFEIYKFRTMYIHKESPNKLRQASKNDERITKIGDLLRHWSIDEFPQFVNVLKGDMSIVGPRPHAKEHNEYYGERIMGYMQRHSFKPGITGLAQVSALRGETKISMIWKED